MTRRLFSINIWMRVFNFYLLLCILLNVLQLDYRHYYCGFFFSHYRVSGISIFFIIMQLPINILTYLNHPLHFEGDIIVSTTISHAVALNNLKSWTSILYREIYFYSEILSTIYPISLDSLSLKFLNTRVALLGSFRWLRL